MMNCEVCTEFLADFLLDELPASQAVLVHEHLNLCLGCSRTYKELKGTGIALEAIPEMKPVQPTQEFEKKVKVLAASELAAIVARLPVEQRVRLEARRAVRRSQSMTRSVPISPKFSWASPLIVISVVVFLTVSVLVFISKRDPAAIVKAPLGKLVLSNGKTEQLSGAQESARTPALAGREILPEDAYLTTDNGCARFELIDGSDLFVGPTTKISFAAGSGKSQVTTEFEFGQIGIQRKADKADKSESAAACEFSEIHCGTNRILVEKNAHVYMNFEKSKQEKGRASNGTLDVLHGVVHVYAKDATERIALAAAGTRLTLSSTAAPVSTPLLLPVLAPAWRVDLITENDLSRWINTPVKITSRTQAGVEVVLSYGGSTTKFVNRDTASISYSEWRSENNECLVQRVDGCVVLPSRSRLKHTVPFTAPISLDVALGSEMAQESTLAFGVLESSTGGLSVDVGSEATLQVRVAGRPPLSASIPVRKTNKPEHLRLSIVRESAGLTAVLTASGGKSKMLSFSFPHDKIFGDCWIQALGNGVAIESIQLTALIPNEWLRANLSTNVSIAKE